MVDTMKLWWAWRNKAKRPLLRSIVLVLVALIFTAATVAASIFSSLVVDASNIVVLVDSPDCGWESLIRMYSNAYVYPVKAASAPYARQCYTSPGSNQTIPASCDVFVQRMIPFDTYNASCPFDKRLCQKGVESVKFDTGFVDVSSAFGLNIDKSDAVKFRKKTTCSILSHEKPWVQGVRYSVNEDGTPTHRNNTDMPLSLKFQYGTKIFGQSKNTTFAVDVNTAIDLQGYTLQYVDYLSIGPQTY
jgi:hypothetical protein